MSKKIIMGLAPLLAVAAFAVMPAMASAATTAYGVCEVGGTHSAECPEGEKAFRAFEELTPVKVMTQKAVGSGNFILKTTATKSEITCEGLVNYGEVENVAGIGISTERPIFRHCSTTFEGKNCKLNTAGAGAGVIVGIVNEEVITETTVKATVVRGFKLVFSGPPPTGCPAAGTAIGTITGSVTGTQAKGSNVLVFSAAKGIKLGTEETETTGSDETYTEGGKPVVIGPERVWFVDGAQLSSEKPPSRNFKPSATLGNFNVTSEKLGVHIDCTKVALLTSSTIENSTEMKLRLQFTGCTAPEPAHCAVHNGEIKTSQLEGLLGAGALLALRPKKAGEELAVVALEGSGGVCKYEEQLPLEIGKGGNGAWNATLKSPEAETFKKALAFEAATSELALKTMPAAATIELEGIELELSETWSAKP